MLVEFLVEFRERVLAVLDLLVNDGALTARPRRLTIGAPGVPHRHQHRQGLHKERRPRDHRRGIQAPVGAVPAGVDRREIS